MQADKFSQLLLTTQVQLIQQVAQLKDYCKNPGIDAFVTALFFPITGKSEQDPLDALDLSKELSNRISELMPFDVYDGLGFKGVYDLGLIQDLCHFIECFFLDQPSFVVEQGNQGFYRASRNTGDNPQASNDPLLLIKACWSNVVARKPKHDIY